MHYIKTLIKSIVAFKFYKELSYYFGDLKNALVSIFQIPDLVNFSLMLNFGGGFGPFNETEILIVLQGIMTQPSYVLHLEMSKIRQSLFIW